MPVDVSPLVWVDGSPGNVLPVSDRGLAYGDGVFETIRVSGGKVTLADYHWARLAQACERLKLPLDIDLLSREVGRFLALAEAGLAVLKVIVTRGSGGRGYSPEGCFQSRRVLSLHPLPGRKPDPAYSGARVKPCELRLGSSALAGMKHLNRLDQVMARAELQGGCFDEGLVCDDRGFLVEGTMSNLFLVTHGGELLTPDLSRAGVMGVCRQYILENARHWGLRTGYAALSPGELDVSEIFLCNSVNGVWPVIEYGDQVWEIGPVTTLVRDRILEELHG